MITGIAYGFFDYEGRPDELQESLEKHKQTANFQENLRFSILDDKVSTNDRYYDLRKKLPLKITEIAEITELYGCYPSTGGRDLPISPKKCIDLRYIIQATAPEVTDNNFLKPIDLTRANLETAGMLKQVFGMVGYEEIQKENGLFFRSAVFYQDKKGIVERLN